MSKQGIIEFNIFSYQISWSLNAVAELIININKPSRCQPNMLNHFSFQTQANFDDDSFSEMQSAKVYSLPATTENSPGSFRSESSPSISFVSNHEDSFEMESQVNHAHNIWSASVELLSSSLESSIDSSKGFNDDRLFSGPVVPAKPDRTLQQVIRNNRLLRCKERTEFMMDLQKEAEVCSLLVELMVLFNETVFHELIYVIHGIWDRKYTPYRQNKLNSKAPIIPQFKRFFGFQDEEMELEGVSVEVTDSAQVNAAAEEDIEQLAYELFLSKRLKYLNFQNGKADKKSRAVLRANFVVFLKAVSRALFLSAEGIFEEDIVVPDFSEEEEMESECSWFEKGNRFVRTFGQIQQDEDETDSYCALSKRRKL